MKGAHPIGNRWITLGLALGLCGLPGCDRPQSEAPAPNPATNASAAHPLVKPSSLRVLPAVVLISGEARCQTRRIFFAHESAELTDESQRELMGYARCLTTANPDEGVIVRGRADPRGTELYNQSLSERRAEAAAAFLQLHGVTPDRITIRALGEEGMQEGMPELWSAQRRVTATPVALRGGAPLPAAQIHAPSPETR